MPVNVTYILGAGASFERLPLVKAVKMPDGTIRKSLGQEMLAMADNIEHLYGSSSTITEKPSYAALLKGFRELGRSSDDFSSPDTFIKSLEFKNKLNEVESAKLHLSLFLLAKQYATVSTDSRYISFLASILKKDNGIVSIPSNIKVLSWNYDVQLELALAGFTTISFNDVFSFFDICPNIDKEVTNPSIIHLNGIAGFFWSEKRKMKLSRDWSPGKTQIFEEILENYEPLKRGYSTENLLTFAWKLLEQNDSRVEYAEKIAKETEVLVVIGYSFPFFNREVDRRIFSKMFEGRAAQKQALRIYIQDPTANIERMNTLKKSLGIPQHVSVEPIPVVDQFFLPPEL